jgi:hypothetical protein
MNTAATRPSQSTSTQPEQALYVAFELSSRTWKLGMSVGFGQKARERNVSAGDLAALSEEISTHAWHVFGWSEVQSPEPIGCVSWPRPSGFPT